jgi:DNA polymerase I-like protein with 3'-5' exonuclease and polymerase domains
VSGESTLLEAIDNGDDIHTATANRVWGGESDASIRAAVHSLELDGTGNLDTPEVAKMWKHYGVTNSNLKKMDERNKVQIAEDWMNGFGWDIVVAEKSIGKKIWRTRSKSVTFCKIFGGGVKAAKEWMQCTEEEARAFLHEYDVMMPGIKAYIRELSNQARRDGQIVNRYGRILQVDPDKPYKAVNYMVQGSAADLMKRAMVKTARYLKETGLDWHLVLTIHDELVFEALKAHARRSVLRNIKALMEDHEGAFSVPTPVDIERVTVSWDQKEAAVY